MFIAKATKPSQDAPVGIMFSEDSKSGCIILTKINENGLFANSQLSPGQEVVAVNGEKVRGEGTSTFKSLLASCVGEIKIETRTSIDENSFGLEMKIRGDEGIHLNLPDFPFELAAIGVPSSIWDKIISSFQKEIAPSVQDYWKVKRTFHREMTVLSFKYGQNETNRHERKLLLMSNQLAVLHSTLSMVAGNVLTRTNCMLNRYGIYTELVLYSHDLPKYYEHQTGNNVCQIPVGLKFSQLAAGPANHGQVFEF